MKMYKFKCGFLEIIHSFPPAETERIYHISLHISIGFTTEFIRLPTPLTCLDGLCYILILTFHLFSISDMLMFTLQRPENNVIM